jgi:hypothetical protein
MKLRLALLFNLCVAAGFGQYVWDYTKNPVVADTNRWSSNGSPSYGSYGVNFSGPGGSLISIPGISVENPTTGQLTSSNSSDYEVSSTLALKSGGGTYIHFLRASSGTVVSGAGSYISVEIVIPSNFTSPGAATLNVNQCINGTITQLGSVSITAADGMGLRTVITGSTVLVFTTVSAQETNWLVWFGTASVTSGNPGIGGHDIPAGSGFTGIWLGHRDVVAPGVISATSITSSVFPNSVSLRWQGVVDDLAGIGLFRYDVYRNGVWAAQVSEPEFVDYMVSPSTTYSYNIIAQDFHGNFTQTQVSVTTPRASAVDPHRTGIYSTGSYWGGGGEQMDTLSGNLNFSVPLLKAQGRTGWTVPVGLVYNSQNWRQDNGVNWKLGDDVGYGFGWQMLIGSITPYYQCYWCGVQYYVYTDPTGAQYRLDQNSNGVWSGTNGVYVWFDSNADKLHFKNGSFWVMGSTSGGTEADAGTMYPTIIEDVYGNQVIITYAPGAGLPASGSNSSARITTIEDSRAVDALVNPSPPYKTYTFVYNSDTPVPHLTSVSNSIYTGEVYSMTYAENAALEPPFELLRAHDNAPREHHHTGRKPMGVHL